MKLSHPTLQAIIVSIAVVLSTSCKEQSEEAPTAKGLLRIELGINVIVPNDGGSLKAANLDDFKVFIYTSDDDLFITYDRVADVPDPVELPEGNYYVEVTSDNLVEAAFESPFYLGVSEDFTVEAGETTTVSVECTLANLMVSVVYSQQVISGFDTYVTTVSTSMGSLVFDETEIRRGFFNVRPLHIEALLTYIDGSGTAQTKTLTGNISSPQARRHYEIHVDAAKDAANGVLDITLDTNAITEVIELNEDVPADPPSGEVIITEFMANPDALVDDLGEWMEFYNTTPSDIDLEGYTVVRVGSSNEFTISGSLVVPSMGYIVLVNNAQATATNDYVYSGFSMTNTGGQIQLQAPDGTVVFDISYTGGKVAAGASAQLDPGSLNSADYSNMDNWCLGTQAYASGDLGTPGAENTACP